MSERVGEEVVETERKKKGPQKTRTAFYSIRSPYSMLPYRTPRPPAVFLSIAAKLPLGAFLLFQLPFRLFLLFFSTFFSPLFFFFFFFLSCMYLHVCKVGFFPQFSIVVVGVRTLRTRGLCESDPKNFSSMRI